MKTARIFFSFWIRNRDKLHLEQWGFLWSPLARIYYEDLEIGLKLLNELTSDHTMRVNLASSFLNETVGHFLNILVHKMQLELMEKSFTI